jgi:hypothetical protein
MPRPRALQKELHHLELVAENRSDKIGSAAFYTLDVIDTKTQSLLTHVSIMMAILAMFYGEASTTAEIRLAILVELMLYLIITLGCLRAVFLVAPTALDTTSEAILETRVREVARRRTAYRISLFATIAVTAAFLLTIATHEVLRIYPSLLRIPSA